MSSSTKRWVGGGSHTRSTPLPKERQMPHCALSFATLFLHATSHLPGIVLLVMRHLSRIPRSRRHASSWATVGRELPQERVGLRFGAGLRTVGAFRTFGGCTLYVLWYVLYVTPPLPAAPPEGGPPEGAAASPCCTSLGVHVMLSGQTKSSESACLVASGTGASTTLSESPESQAAAHPTPITRASAPRAKRTNRIRDLPVLPAAMRITSFHEQLC